MQGFFGDLKKKKSILFPKKILSKSPYLYAWFKYAAKNYIYNDV